MNLIKSEFKRLKNIAVWVFSIYFKEYPFYISFFIISELVLSLGNLLNAYIIALVTDKAIEISTSGDVSLLNFLPVLYLIIGSYVFFEVLRIFNRYVWRTVTYQDSYMLREILAKRLAYLGVQNLEKPEISNKAQRFNEEVGNISGFLELTVSIFTGFFSFVSAGVILINSIPFVAGLFSIVMVLQFLVNQKYIRKLWLIRKETTEDRRKANTSLNLVSEPAPLKELILSGGDSYLNNKVNEYLESIIIRIKKSWIEMSSWQVVMKILDASVFGYGIVIILTRLVEKIITIGQLTFEIRSLRIFADSFIGFTSNLVQLRENAVKINDVYELFTTFDSEKDGETIITGDNNDIVYENVKFKYPNSQKLVLDGLSLTIRNGEKVAIVGENGAGKTTLIKLIARIYRPTSGKVLINNININDLKLRTWYEK